MTPSSKRGNGTGAGLVTCQRGQAHAALGGPQTSGRVVPSAAGVQGARNGPWEVRSGLCHDLDAADLSSPSCSV